MTNTKAVLRALMDWQVKSREQIASAIGKPIPREVFYALKKQGLVEEVPVSYRITSYGVKHATARPVSAADANRKAREMKAKREKAKRDRAAMRERTKRVNAQLSAARASQTGGIWPGVM